MINLFNKNQFLLLYLTNLLAMVSYSFHFRFGDIVADLGYSARLTGVVAGIAFALLVVGKTFLPVFGSSRAIKIIWVMGCALILIAHIISCFFYKDIVAISAGRFLLMIGLSICLLCPFIFIPNVALKGHPSTYIAILSTSTFLGMASGALFTQLSYNLWPQFKYEVIYGVGLFIASLHISLILIFNAVSNNFLQKEVSLRNIFKHFIPFKGGIPVALYFVALVTGAGFVNNAVFLTQYLANKNFNSFGLFFFSYCLCAVIIQVATRHWTSHIGSFRVIVLGLSIFAFGQLFLISIAEAWHVIFAAVCCGAARALLYPAIISAGMQDSQSQTSNSSNIISVVDLGTLVWSLLMGYLVAGFGFQSSFAITALFMGFALGAFILIERKRTLTKFKRREDDFRHRRKEDLTDEPISSRGEHLVTTRDLEYFANNMVIACRTRQETQLCFAPATLDAINQIALKLNIKPLPFTVVNKYPKAN